MKKAIAAAFAIMATASAHAAIIDAKFTGTVASQAGTALVLGNAISGEFLYNTATSAYQSFTIGGVSITVPFASSASITPDLYSALYQAQISPLTTGGTVNKTFVLDLEGLNKWPSNDAVALLTNTAVLPSNLDLITSPNDLVPSTFGYNTSNSNGTGVVRVTANLATITVSSTAVPEPASFVILASALLLGAGFLPRRG